MKTLYAASALAVLLATAAYADDAAATAEPVAEKTATEKTKEVVADAGAKGKDVATKDSSEEEKEIAKDKAEDVKAPAKAKVAPVKKATKEKAEVAKEEAVKEEKAEAVKVATVKKVSSKKGKHAVCPDADNLNGSSKVWTAPTAEDIKAADATCTKTCSDVKAVEAAATTPEAEEAEAKNEEATA